MQLKRMRQTRQGDPGNEIKCCATAPRAAIMASEEPKGVKQNFSTLVKRGIGRLSFAQLGRASILRPGTLHSQAQALVDTIVKSLGKEKRKAPITGLLRDPIRCWVQMTWDAKTEMKLWGVSFLNSSSPELGHNFEVDDGTVFQFLSILGFGNWAYVPGNSSEMFGKYDYSGDIHLSPDIQLSLHVYSN